MAKNHPIRHSSANEGGRSLTTKLHVQRLPVTTTDAELQSLFAGVGRVINCEVITDGPTRTSKAIILVEVATAQEVRRAIDQLNGKELDGRVIRVSEFDTEFERVKRSCADVASEMWCPRHFMSAKVEMDGESLDDFSMEVITCCEEFRRRVEQALDKLVPHRV